MSIDTLQDNVKGVPLPENIQAKVDNAINMVSTAEADYGRIQKLVISEKGVLLAIQEEKRSLETKIKGLKTDLTATIDLVAKEKLILQALESEKTNAKEELKTLLQEIESNRDSLVKSKAELDKREGAVVDYERNINTRNLELIKKETEHAAKVERLRRAID